MSLGEIPRCNRALTRTSNTIALHGVTGKERAKTRLMQIFARSPDARNLSASHNFENNVAMTILIAAEIAVRYKKKKITQFSFVFDERESGRQNTTDECHERDYVTIVKYA